MVKSSLTRLEIGTPDEQGWTRRAKSYKLTPTRLGGLENHGRTRTGVAHARPG